MGFLHGEPPQDSLLASGSPRESPSSFTLGLAARGRRRGGTSSRGGEGLDVIRRPAANLATGRRTDRLQRVSRRGTDYLRNSIRFEFSFPRNAPARIAGAATSFARRSRCLTSQPDRSGPNKAVAGPVRPTLIGQWHGAKTFYAVPRVGITEQFLHLGFSGALKRIGSQLAIQASMRSAVRIQRARARLPPLAAALRHFSHTRLRTY